MKNYLYEDLISSEYYYTFDNTAITVYKDCNNIQCTCEKVFVNYNYIRSQEYSCTYNQPALLDYHIDYTNFTSDFYYRTDFSNILIIFFILTFFIIWCPIKIILRFFKRFN